MDDSWKNFVGNPIDGSTDSTADWEGVDEVERTFYILLPADAARRDVMAEVEGRLEVKVSPGFADSEYYVMVPDGPAVFVSRDLVSVSSAPTNDEPVEGQVKVYVIDQGDEEALIELPGEPVIGGLRARVRRSLLLPA